MLFSDLNERRGARNDTGSATQRSDPSSVANDRSLWLYLRGIGGENLEVGRLPASTKPGDGWRDGTSRPVVTETALLLPASESMNERRLFEQAALAHAVAHARYSESGMSVGKRGPLMIAMLSLIEDARVERLMAEEYPGLQALWGRLFRPHDETREMGLTFSALAARLSLALHDSAYRDPFHWVEKGRELLLETECNPSDVARYREVAAVLANDLGQMRVRFDSQYCVYPPYRDDNTYLWRFAEDEPLAAVLESRGAQARASNDATTETRDQSHGQPTPLEKAPLCLLYPEWNYQSETLRPDWVTVVEGEPIRVSSDNVLQLRSPSWQTAVQVRHRQVHAHHKLRRQHEGDDLDLDALISHVIKVKGSDEPDGRIFTRAGRRSRNVSLLLLLDLSVSTGRPTEDRRQTLLDWEREASRAAISALGDEQMRVAVHGFSSNGRAEVRYVRFKDFGERFEEHHWRRLNEVQPAWSTRIGAALRHAGSALAQEENSSKTIILVSDGEPSDIDVFDRRYLVEDARHAVVELKARGIRAQCINVKPEAHELVCDVFGWRNCISVSHGGRLPDVLPRLLSRAVG